MSRERDYLSKGRASVRPSQGEATRPGPEPEISFTSTPVNMLRRLLRGLSPRRLFDSTGVRTLGANALVVAIEDRSYWVHAQIRPGRPPEYRVCTSDTRDITTAATVVSAPPANGAIVPEVEQRIGSYVARHGGRVSYC